MSATVQQQVITPELHGWITTQLAKGCNPVDMLVTMHSSGWADAVARQALQAALPAGVELPPSQSGPAAPGSGQAQTASQAACAQAMPGPHLQDNPNLVLADGHEVQVLFSLRQPRVVLFGGLLTAAECDELIAQARPRLERSLTVVHATGGSEVNASRTSDGMFFQRGETALIQRIEQRIAQLLRWPVAYGEGLQVLHYRPGAQYKPHYDYFDPAQPGTAAVLRRGGQRLGTLVMYLNMPEQGGATVFPDVGLEVAPAKGHAVFFAYPRPEPATQTLHGGAPVLAGEKWVATKWLREAEFR